MENGVAFVARCFALQNCDIKGIEPPHLLPITHNFVIRLAVAIDIVVFQILRAFANVGAKQTERIKITVKLAALVGANGL